MEITASLSYERFEEIGIGEGMNSKVFRCSDSQTAGELAVKEIPKSTFGNVVSKYFEEAQTMFAVAHTNVVPIQYGCQTPDNIVLAMPYYRNGSLAKRILMKPLSLESALRTGQGVLAGIAQIHMQGYLHLDVRPPNILYASNGQPLVADFGQSRRFDTSGTVTAPETYIHAMPPETLNLGVATAASDVYQVGLLLYRAANGDPLVFSTSIRQERSTSFKEIEAGKFPDRKRFLPHVPKRLRTIIRKALSIDPSSRYQSATDMADALAGVRLDLNWETTLTPQETRWTARRPGAPDLVVRRSLQDWSGNWDVTVFTRADGKERARGRELYWKESLSTKEADKHLNELFSELR